MIAPQSNNEEMIVFVVSFCISSGYGEGGLRAQRQAVYTSITVWSRSVRVKAIPSDADICTVQPTNYLLVVALLSVSGSLSHGPKRAWGTATPPIKNEIAQGCYWANLLSSALSIGVSSNLSLWWMGDCGRRPHAVSG